MPVGWFWFPDEQTAGDQAVSVREALAARGVRVAPAAPVGGGLDATQAWTRAVLWAAGLAE
jgi:hypothetical protein